MNKTLLLNLVAGVALLTFCLMADARENKPMTAQHKLDNAYFAMGCFWKTQYVFSKIPGVVATKAGYTGGKTENPSYERVCTHGTGHAEAVKVVYDPSKVSYKQLLDAFWSHHDPTTRDRQGFDIGNQYRSAIFFENADQQHLAQASKADQDSTKRFRNPIVTEILPAGHFYDAENYHQDYFVKHGAVCN